MTKFFCYFVIILHLFTGIETRLIDLPQVGKLKFETAQAEPERFELTVQRRQKRLVDGFKGPIHPEKFPPDDLVAQCKNEIYARFVRWKNNREPARSQGRERLTNRFRSKRKKHTNEKKRYVDYTNSQMPFNEGVKAAKMPQFQVDKTKSDHVPEFLNDVIVRDTFDRTAVRKRVRATATLETLEEELPDNYSRVRRFLDQERVKKRVRATATLEAKEAAMSGVLDPNLNLDGILEPHVRKRRDERLSLDVGCDYVAPSDWDEARKYEQNELLSS
ncbi:hypothetical protein RUM44_011604 [Polyplax serrata]|uniref:Uncharacterized protein n=1 Tax=Polyplax serrata TaxID=468196 RepID=A0ABR1AQL0_POLSC